MSRPKLGDLLVEANLIDEVQLKIALEEQKSRGTRFGSTLLALHFIEEDVLAAFLSRQLDMPCVSLHNIEIPARVLAKVPKEMATELHIVPIRQEKERIFVAMSDPFDMESVEAIEKQTGLAVTPMVAPESSIEDCLQRFYCDEGSTREEVQKAVVGVFPDLVRELEELEVFGHHFREINDRLEKLELVLTQIRDLLAKLSGDQGIK
jgi:type IV pilus assembly protein PilB